MPDASRACRVQREDRYGSRAGQGQLSVGAQSGNERLMRPSATRREATWKRQVKTGPIRPDVRKERRSPPRCAKLTCSTDCGAGERGGAGGPRWTKESRTRLFCSVSAWLVPNDRTVQTQDPGKTFIPNAFGPALATAMARDGSGGGSGRHGPADASGRQGADPGRVRGAQRHNDSIRRMGLCM
jgi:hypothetical protein